MNENKRNIRDEDIFKEFITGLRELHEFRREMEELIPEFQNDSQSEIAQKVDGLLKLPTEEITEKFSDRMSPEFEQEILPIIDYANETARVKRFENTKRRAELIILSDYELKQCALGEARYETRQQYTGSPLEKLQKRVRQMLNRHPKEEKIREQKRAQEILRDLHDIINQKGKAKAREPFFFSTELPIKERDSLKIHSEKADKLRTPGNASSRESRSQELAEPQSGKEL